MNLHRKKSLDIYCYWLCLRFFKMYPYRITLYPWLASILQIMKVTEMTGHHIFFCFMF